MWLFRRRGRADAGDQVARQPPAGQAPGPGAGWRSLAPIQRVVTPMPRVVGTSSFEASLSSWRDPAFLGPLGHHVSADAPSGIAFGLAAPAAPRTIQRSGELPLRQARRPSGRASAGAFGHPAILPGGAVPADAAEAPTPAGIEPGEAPAAPVSLEVGAAEPVQRDAESVQPAVESTPPATAAPVQADVQLTVAPPVVLPPLRLRTVQRAMDTDAATSPAEPDGHDEPTLAAEPAPGMEFERIAEPAPHDPAHPLPLAPEAAVSAGQAEPEGQPQEPEGAAPTLGREPTRPQRSGLGPPLRGPRPESTGAQPPPAPVQRFPAAPHRSANLGPPIAPAISASAPVQRAAQGEPTQPTDAMPDRPPLPLTGQQRPGVAGASRSPDQAPVSEPVARVQREGAESGGEGDAEPPVAPLLAGRPLAPVSAQRPSEELPGVGGPQVSSGVGGQGQGVGPVARVQREGAEPGGEPQEVSGSVGAQELPGVGPGVAAAETSPVDAPPGVVAGPAGVEGEPPVAPLLAGRPLAPVSAQRAVDEVGSRETPAAGVTRAMPGEPRAEAEAPAGVGFSGQPRGGGLFARVQRWAVDSGGGGGDAEPQDLPGFAGTQELPAAGPVAAPPQMPLLPVDAPEAVAASARSGVKEPIRSAPEPPSLVAPLLAARPLALVSAQRVAEQRVLGEPRGAGQAPAQVTAQGVAQDYRVAGSPQAPGDQRAGAEFTRAVTEAPPAPGPAIQPHGTAPFLRLQRNLAGPGPQVEVRPRFSSVSRGMVQAPRAGHWPAGDQLPLVQRAATPVSAGAGGDPRTAALSTGLAAVDRDGAIVFPGLAAHIAPMSETATAPPIQRQAASPTAEAPAASPEPAAATTPAAATPPAAGGKPAELDELAKKLYERIRTRLKAELRLDRERAGLLTDLGR